jgi:7-keto-8-aminopelargonate synthetase-like enzyme
VAGEREVFIDLKPGMRIRFRRSEAPPPISYAITLEALEDGEWATVRLWDNADDVDEHHEHEHTQGGGKQPPAILEFKSTNDAMAAAIRKAKDEAAEIVRKWRAS